MQSSSQNYPNVTADFVSVVSAASVCVEERLKN